VCPPPDSSTQNNENTHTDEQAVHVRGRHRSTPLSCSRIRRRTRAAQPRGGGAGGQGARLSGKCCREKCRRIG
jgi:hypothetical protein